MNRHTFNYLENIVYNYRDTLKQIDEIEKEMLYGKEEKDDIQAGRTNVKNINDDTANRAVALMTDKRLTRLKEQSYAVERAYRSLTKEKQKLIRAYYWDSIYKKSMDKLANSQHVSVRTAYRWRREFIYAIGDLLGEN